MKIIRFLLNKMLGGDKFEKDGDKSLLACTFGERFIFYGNKGSKWCAADPFFIVFLPNMNWII